MVYSWWILFIGAFLDAVIGVNLFFHGEPFFVAAGFLLYKGSLLGVFAVYIAGFLGDQVSYFIGKKHGQIGIKKIKQKFPKTRKGFILLKKQLKRRGLVVISGSRLLGPIAWVTPFFVGANNIPWLKFTLYSFIGLFFGIGQFILIGFLLSAGVEQFPYINETKILLNEHIDLILYTTISFILTILILLKFKTFLKKLLFILLTFILCLGALNFTHFFVRDGKSPEIKEYNITNLNELNFSVYAGESSYYEPQPINLIYKGDDPSELMIDLKWIKNKTFSKDQISLIDYLKLMKNKTPPVSDLFWNKEPQYYAYQEAGDLINRNHLRWWFAGKYENQNIWVGAISYDNEVEISLYKGIVTLLHDIDPDVDKERNRFKNTINKTNNYKSELKPLSQKNEISENFEFNTDGQVLIINKLK